MLLLPVALVVSFAGLLTVQLSLAARLLLRRRWLPAGMCLIPPLAAYWAYRERARKTLVVGSLFAFAYLGSWIAFAR